MAQLTDTLIFSNNILLNTQIGVTTNFDDTLTHISNFKNNLLIANKTTVAYFVGKEKLNRLKTKLQESDNVIGACFSFGLYKTGELQILITLAKYENNKLVELENFLLGTQKEIGSDVIVPIKDDRNNTRPIPYIIITSPASQNVGLAEKNSFANSNNINDKKAFQTDLFLESRSNANHGFFVGKNFLRDIVLNLNNDQVGIFLHFGLNSNGEFGLIINYAIKNDMNHIVEIRPDGTNANSYCFSSFISSGGGTGPPQGPLQYPAG